jgi:hypothetical protein
MHIDVWRMSAGRPHFLAATQPSLIKHLKFKGEIRYHLIESVLIRELSQKCIEWAKDNNFYSVNVISPAGGQGYAVEYALTDVVTSPYSLKWEDDFMAEVDIPLDDCVEVMENYSKVNQICFNKRTTIASKKVTNENGDVYEWKKEQCFFPLGKGKTIPLVLKERWWFGASVWRQSFIKPLFQYWPSNTHNLFNDRVLLPLAGSKLLKDGVTIVHPNQQAIADKIGCYIYGKVGDPRMAEHIGREESIWKGLFQEKAKAQGLTIVEGAI